MEEQPAANGRVTNNEASRNERDVAIRIQPENVELDGDLNGSVQLLPEDPKKAKSAQSTSVIVVGAGPVGMFLALRLGKAKINVVVIEKEEALNDDPRAVGYFGASALAMLNAGVYEKIREEGFMIKGLCWRKKPVEDAELGGKRLGEMIAAMPLAELDDDEMIPPRGLLCLQQAFLTKLLSREAIATGHVSVLFKHQLVAIRDELTSITATARDDRDGSLHNITGSFLAGTDGGRSATRKLLGIPMVGHTWPERLLATDVMVPNLERPNYHCHYVLDRTNFTVSTPLEEPTGNQTTLWRYTMALDPNDDRSDEEILSKSHIMSLYEKVMAGPRPLKADIVRSSTYRIHQRLATTLRMGRSLLAGDAAHMCSVSSETLPHLTTFLP